MVDMTTVREVMKEMTTFVRAQVPAASTIKHRRSDQLVNAADFPFLLWNPSDDEVEGAHQNIQQSAFKVGDDTIVEKKRSERNRLTINIHAVDVKKPDVPFDVIKQARQFFRTQTGKDFCGARGYVPRLLGQIVTNITNLRETTQLPRVSFSLRLDFVSKLIEEISSIDTIGLEIDTGLPGDPESKSIPIKTLTT